MPQKFFTDTLISKFIKNMLLNTPLPLINTVREFDYIIENCFYVYRTNVIKCTKSGTLVSNHLEFANKMSENLSNDIANTQQGIIDTQAKIDDPETSEEEKEKLQVLLTGLQAHLINIQNKSFIEAEYTIVQPFVWGRDLTGVTERFFSKYNYYDSDTHLYLGKYLRCLRDIKDIDLMPFYNCFNYKIVSDISLPLEDTEVDGNKKVLAVPIKFNKTYTVAIDSGTRVLMKSVLYGDFGLLKSRDGTDLTSQLNEQTVVCGHLDFLQPTTYKIECYDKNLLNLEKYLYLIIQLSSSNSSSVVVLEGDYTHLDSTKIINVDDLNKVPDKELDNIFLSKLGLLQINDTNIYAFSNRLIEYLLLNAITSDDEISHNIYTIQQKLDLFKDSRISKGVWDNYMRYLLYNTYMNRQNITKLDINGFVDKDVERYIMRGV